MYRNRRSITNGSLLPSVGKTLDTILLSSRVPLASAFAHSLVTRPGGPDGTPCECSDGTDRARPAPPEGGKTRSDNQPMPDSEEEFMHRLAIFLGAVLLLAFDSAVVAQTVCKPTASPETESCGSGHIQTFARATNPCDCDATVTIHPKSGGAAILFVSKNGGTKRDMIEACGPKQLDFTYSYEFTCPNQGKNKSLGSRLEDAKKAALGAEQKKMPRASKSSSCNKKKRLHELKRIAQKQPPRQRHRRLANCANDMMQWRGIG
jgi:hypothetical protein